MKRLAAVALLVAGMALSAWGQRGGVRGGGSSRGMAMSRGGFAPSSRPSFAAPRLSAPPAFRMSGGYTNAMPGLRTASRYPNRRPVVTTRRFRAPYVPIPYNFAIPYGPSYFDYPADYDPSYSEAPAQPSYPANDPGAYGPADQSVAPPDSYRPAYLPYQPAPANEEAVTLIFNDGRPSEQIHNYILSRTTLSVQDGRRRDIPVADLDLAATQKVNRDAGIDFQLPAARR